ncbi:MAG: hypothetical protein C5B57_09255 [Blastocatellia bacterium]|nr:MAG: hypothetical protein C5B57_09255 [Blastocatellia bacterium]
MSRATPLTVGENGFEADHSPVREAPVKRERVHDRRRFTARLLPALAPDRGPPSTKRSDFQQRHRADPVRALRLLPSSG